MHFNHRSFSCAVTIIVEESTILNYFLALEVVDNDETSQKASAIIERTTTPIHGWVGFLF
jgi:hypothetical protein